MVYIVAGSSIGAGGYNQSSLARPRQNIMDDRSPEKITNMFGAKAEKDPLTSTVGVALQGALQSITSPGVTSDNSPMSKLLPNKSYEAPPTTGLARSATKQMTDGAKVSTALGQAKEQTQENIAEFKKDFQDARTQLIEAVKEAAQQAGMDPSNAVDSVFAKPETTMADALAFAATEASTGGMGSFMTATMKGGYVMASASKSDKKLNPEQQRAVLEDALKILQSAPATPQATSASIFDQKAQDSSLNSTRFNWQQITEQDLKAIADDPDGENQPELKRLREAEANIDADLNDLAIVKNEYAQNNAGEKLSTLPDAGGISLAGEGLKGMSGIVLETGLAIADIKGITPEQPKPDLAARVLEREAVSQIRLG